MGFKLKSGNRTSFKQMGGTEASPAKDMKTGSYKQSFESPAKQKNEKVSKEMQNKMAEVKAANLAETNKILKSQGKPPVEQIKESPAKQKVNKGGEGKDQNKIFDEKGNHIGNWVNDKKVMFNDKPAVDQNLRRDKLVKKMEKKDLKTLKSKGGATCAKCGVKSIDHKSTTHAFTTSAHDPDWEGGDTFDVKPKPQSPAKQVKTSGLGPRSSFGGVKNPELTKDKKKPFSTKVMRDGLKNAAHGVKDPGNWQPHQFKKKKSPAKDKPVLTHDHNYGKESGEKQSPAKQTKDTFKDGSKKSSRDKFNDTETAIEQRKADRKDDQRRFTNKGVKTIVGEKSSGLGPRAKNSGMTRTQAARNRAEMSGLDSKSPYWFKINGKTVNKKQYLNYENKPGNMEGGGKQTNHPDVYGRKANNHGRGPKTK